jgi:hypothetical protein
MLKLCPLTVCSVILFSSDNYVICHQIYGFCLPIWHLQIFPTNYMYIELEGRDKQGNDHWPSADIVYNNKQCSTNHATEN